MTHHEHCDCQGNGCECGDDCRCGCNGKCSCCGKFHRRYQTAAEQLQELESYLADLRLEVQAVEERIAQLKK